MKLIKMLGTTDSSVLLSVWAAGPLKLSTTAFASGIPNTVLENKNELKIKNHKLRKAINRIIIRRCTQ